MSILLRHRKYFCPPFSKYFYLSDGNDLSIKQFKHQFHEIQANSTSNTDFFSFLLSKKEGKISPIIHNAVRFPSLTN